LPNATLKQHPDLNCAYAFSVSESIVEVLAELREALESNGFTRAEAERIILPVPQPLLPLGAQAKTVAVDVEKELDAPLAQKQAEALAGRVKLDTAKDEVAGVGGVNGVLDVGGGGEPVGVGGGRGWVRGIDVMSRRDCERSSSPQEGGCKYQTGESLHWVWFV